MARYRKKPIVIDAMQLDSNSVDVCSWLTSAGASFRTQTDPYSAARDVLFIRTLEGEMRADPGDFVIQGVRGEFYPCKRDIFEATYERVD